MEDSELKLILAPRKETLLGYFISLFVFFIFFFLILPFDTGFKLIMLTTFVFGLITFCLVYIKTTYQLIHFKKDEVLFKKSWLLNSKVFSYKLSELERVEFDQSVHLTFYFKDFKLITLELCEPSHHTREGIFYYPLYQIKRNDKIILLEYPINKGMKSPYGYTHSVFKLVDDFYKSKK